MIEYIIHFFQTEYCQSICRRHQSQSHFTKGGSLCVIMQVLITRFCQKEDVLQFIWQQMTSHCLSSVIDWTLMDQ